MAFSLLPLKRTQMNAPGLQVLYIPVWCKSMTAPNRNFDKWNIFSEQSFFHSAQEKAKANIFAPKSRNFRA